MSDIAKHPDLFTSSEALAYLHLPANMESTLETLRSKGMLRGEQFGRVRLYHRAELDACVLKSFAFISSLASGHKQKTARPLPVCR